MKIDLSDQAQRATQQGQLPAHEEATEIAPGIRRSQEAFWRELPQFLSQKALRGQWVLYHGEERVGIARSAEALLREIVRRGLRDDAYYLGVIESHACAPWQVEEVTPPRPGFDWVELNESPPSAAKEPA